MLLGATDGAVIGTTIGANQVVQSTISGRSFGTYLMPSGSVMGIALVLGSGYNYRTGLVVDMDVYENGVSVRAYQTYDVRTMWSHGQTQYADLAFAGVVSVFVDNNEYVWATSVAQRFPTASYRLPTADAVSPSLLYPALDTFVPYDDGVVTDVRLYHGYRFVGLPDQGADVIVINPWAGRRTVLP
jgi:hypothetical protein